VAVAKTWLPTDRKGKTDSQMRPSFHNLELEVQCWKVF
jgi:hypothetical protein